MNFIKGIVDGILATDPEASSGRIRYQYDADDPDNDSEGFGRGDPLQYRINSNDNVFITNSASQLSELYRAERDQCLNALVLRYGEGCVQQLSQLLKSNHETILALAQQLRSSLEAVNEVNGRVESAAVEHLRLRSENNALFQQLNLLSSENASLKSQLTQAGIAVKSSENHIATLKELLKDNRSTFENMRNRCGEFYRFKAEIEDLKKSLALSESHVAMLKREREQFWSDPRHVLSDEDYKRRIAQALEREERAIAVAKVMASQTLAAPPGAFADEANPPPSANQPEPPEPRVSRPQQDAQEEQDSGALAELRLKAERLEDENAHLREINDSMHTMYADLSRSLKEAKTGYLREALEAMSSYLPARARPLQLVFVQPTGVLDLEFDPGSLHQYSHQPQAMKQPTQGPQPGSHSPHSLTSSSQSFGTGLQSSGEYPSKEDPRAPSAQPSRGPERPAKKSSPKLNFRSKVIKYVTNLDGPPPAPETAKPEKLMDLDSPQPRGLEADFHSIEPEPSERSDKSPDKTNKSSNWNSDWDFFEEAPSEPFEAAGQPDAKPATAPQAEPLDEFDFILQQEHSPSQPGTEILHHSSHNNQFPNGEHQFPTGEHRLPAVEHQLPVGEHHFPANQHHFPAGDQKLRVEHPSAPEPTAAHPPSQPPETASHPDAFADEDVFDSIINEGEQPEPKPAPAKSKGWDDIDFDDEMFQA